MASNLNLLRSRLESKQKELIEVLEQLKTGVNHLKDRRTGITSGEKLEAARERFELERCLALESQIRRQLDVAVRTLHKFEKESKTFAKSAVRL